MTTASGSSAPFVGLGSNLVTDVADRPGAGAGHGRRNAVIGLAAGAVTAAALVGIQYARTQDDAAAVPPVPALAKAMQVRDAYAPGGSVYDSQVPVKAMQVRDAYSAGGSVYDSQVPAGAVLDWQAYAPGGSVYDSQVPQP